MTTTQDKWEYKVYASKVKDWSIKRGVGDDEAEKLNSLGEEGWELVSVRGGTMASFIFFFKRKKIMEE